MILFASVSIRGRGSVAAFSCIDVTRSNSRSFQSLKNEVPPFRLSVRSGKISSDFFNAEKTWRRQLRSSLCMSTSSPVSASVDSTVLRRVKTVDAVEASGDESVLIKGWVRTVRKQKTLAFVEVNDGSNMNGIQCVLSFDSIDDDSQKGTMKMFVDSIFL